VRREHASQTEDGGGVVPRLARRAAPALRRSAQGALTILAVVLPFELENPLARVGPLQLSSVELFLYLALATWLAARVVASIGAPPSRRLAWVLPSGAHLVLAGVAWAWFPAPPHSTAAPLSGWPARWFAAGVGWFGLVVAATGMAGLRGRDGPGRPLQRVGCGAFILASACWVAWLVSLLPR